MNRKVITKAIWILSLISFFNDFASEMLFPVIPLYLQTIGFSTFFIGTMEGVANFVSTYLRGIFGALSDRMGQRVPFIRWGYGMSGVAKPLLILFPHAVWVLTIRIMDRLGKSVRTAARDALLADLSDQAHLGKVFGFHRMMDTLGAFIGPFFALVYLHFFPDKYVPLFLLAFLPGMVSIALTFLLKDQEPKTQNTTEIRYPWTFFRYWNHAPTPLKWIFIGIFFFSLFQIQEMLLILRVKELKLSNTYAIGSYMVMTFFYAATAYFAGKWADDWGYHQICLVGVLFFFSSYGAFLFGQTFFEVGLGFILFGCGMGFTEGPFRAWISSVETTYRATALGFHHALQGIGYLLSGSLFGLLWKIGSSSIAFFSFLIGMGLVFLYFLFATFSTEEKEKDENLLPE